jgi:hypothetical protein
VVVSWLLIPCIFGVSIELLHDMLSLSLSLHFIPIVTHLLTNFPVSDVLRLRVVKLPVFIDAGFMNQC